MPRPDGLDGERAAQGVRAPPARREVDLPAGRGEPRREGAAQNPPAPVPADGEHQAGASALHARGLGDGEGKGVARAQRAAGGERHRARGHVREAGEHPPSRMELREAGLRLGGEAPSAEGGLRPDAGNEAVGREAAERAAR